MHLVKVPSQSLVRLVGRQLPPQQLQLNQPAPSLHRAAQATRVLAMVLVLSSLLDHATEMRTAAALAAGSTVANVLVP